jgi:hypothetical protein
MPTFWPPAARARLRAVRAGLAGGGLSASRELTAVVVVDDIAPAALVTGAASFALAMEPGARAGWYRAFTRTVFLAGRPGSVTGRHPHRRLAPGGGLAWYGPPTRRELSALSRMLRTFQGPFPVDVPSGPLAVRVPGRPSGHRVEMTVTTGGVRSDAYLVHVHPLVTEAVLRGLVGPGGCAALGCGGACGGCARCATRPRPGGAGRHGPGRRWPGKSSPDSPARSRRRETQHLLQPVLGHRP